jgi:hypothetical protein
MIPATPYKTKSGGEKKVFEWLRRFNDDSLTAFHSVTTTNQERKRFGEIDFLIVGPKGVFALEIKSGLIHVDSKKVWIYEKGNGQKSKPSREGPFKQAESALHATIEDLEQYFSWKFVRKFTQGYGVITPDCEIVESFEWESRSITHAGNKKCRHFDQWLSELFSYWGGRHKQAFGKAQEVSDSDVEKIVNYIRPEFDVMLPLYATVSDVNDEIISLTKSQMLFADSVEVSPRTLCSGSAGTGKTLLAQETAKRWSQDDKQVLLICYSPWLKNFLETNINLPNVLVTTISALPTAARRFGIEKFDALIVDEGQDLLQFDTLVEKIEPWLEGGFKSGQWCFFYDRNNQANLFKPAEKSAIKFLQDYAPTPIPLRKNCRNTKNILDRIKTDLGADMAISGDIIGPNVESVIVNNEKDSAEKLSQIIDDLVNEAGMNWGEITILSPKPMSKSSVQLLDKKVKRHLVELDEHSMRSFPPEKMSFAEISNFKGLENECIILIDIEDPKNLEKSTNLAKHYVAMSRAKVFLRIIYLD